MSVAKRVDGVIVTSYMPTATGRYFLGTVSPTAAQPSRSIEEAKPRKTAPTMRAVMDVAVAEIMQPITPTALPRIRMLRLPKISPRRPKKGAVTETTT
jgi:hypothetical protein